MKRQFDEMPDAARLWVFASPRALTPPETERLLAVADRFVQGWTAHGAPVLGAYDWRHDRFLLVAADEEASGISGCSIDSLFDALRPLETELGVPLLSAAGSVWFRDAAGAIHALPRPEFRERARKGEVGADTPVFDNTAPSVGAVRNGAWERPMRESWHGRAFLGAAKSEKG